MSTPSLSRDEFDLLRGYIEKLSGVVVGPEKMYLVETRLMQLVVEAGCESFREFYFRVMRSGEHPWRDRVIDSITTHETVWFRDSAPWLAVRDRILPEWGKLVEARPTRRLRVWSAACSTGQEPYSLAMLVDEHLTVPPRLFSWGQVDILATDISPTALSAARAGRYDRISMNRGMGEQWRAFRERYFDASGTTSQISSAIRSRVEFRQLNLQHSFGHLVSFDLIFFRNVAIYFSEERKRALFDRLADALTPEGYLFLGSAETLHGYSARYTQEKHGRATFYRRKG